MRKDNKKKLLKKNLYKFYMGGETILNDFKSKIFLTKSKGSSLLNTDILNLKY